MRVYLPATTSILRRLVDRGEIGPAPLTAFAVTPGLREWYVDDDAEELEYAATLEASRASLRLLAVDPSANPRRVVVAAHVDDRSAETAVHAAADAIDAADLGDAAAQDRVDDAEGFELGWYAAQEIVALVELL